MADVLTWDGLAAFKESLRTLPRDLAADAGVLVAQAAILTEGEIRQRYGAGKTGKLARGLSVRISRDTFGASGVVRNTAKHAAIYEFGSQARHTATGANRGAMPPAKFFVPIAMKHRRALYARLVALVERAGGTVSG